MAENIVPESSKPYLRPLHAFRGLAILDIVLLHSFAGAVYFFAAPGVDGVSALHLKYVSETLFHSGTIYFALISGVLFTAVLEPRGWQRFTRDKLSKVLLPYALMSLLFTSIVMEVGVGLRLWDRGWISFGHVYLENIINGRALNNYWYIPLVMVLFSLTPLLLKSLRSRYANGFLLVFAVTPLFLSRTGSDITLPMFGHFIGIYAIGLYLGEDYGRKRLLLTRRRWYLFVIALVSSVVLFCLYENDFEFFGPVSVRESLFYVQRLAIAGFVIEALHRYEDRLPRWLDIIADQAFAIYFLHLFFLLVSCHYFLKWLTAPVNTMSIFLIALTMALLALLASMAVCYLLKALLGKRSRYIVGA
ncbi:MAG: acyltransferase [Arenimonas sp.]